MAPATPKSCQVPGCDQGELDEMDCGTPYKTPDDLPTRTAVEEDMKNHVYQAHTLEADQEKAKAARITAEAAKTTAEIERLRAEGTPTVCDSGSARGEKKASM